MNYLANGRLFWLFPILVWSALATISAQSGLNNLDGMAEGLAYERAKSMFRLVQMTRLWNAQHGGVYVPVSETTLPNPYLADPERDVVTTNGKELTKLNHSYITRQIANVAKEFNGITLHITSLRPVNPGNAPDSWEKMALMSFEQDTPEVLEYIIDDGAPVYRYMGPLFTKMACMKCHDIHGYAVGDVRGGVSVTLPAEPIISAQQAARSQVIYIHLAAFILLTITTIFLLVKLRQQWQLVQETKDQLAGSEHFLRSITDAAGEGVITLDKNNTITFANPEAKHLLGWSEHYESTDSKTDDAKLKNIKQSYESVAKSVRKTDSDSDSGSIVRVNDSTFIHAKGHQIPISYVASPIMEGAVNVGTVILFQDTTLRKQMEKTLVRSETMSALGGMVAGVAHEVNTPLGVSVTSASYLATKTTDLVTAFKENTLTRSALNTYLEISNESIAIILSNLERAAELIKSFKQVAADQASEAKSSFNLKEYFGNVLITLQPELKRSALEVKIHCPDNILMNSYPGALSQIITNLIINSKTHAFDEDEAGSITFDIEKSGEDIVIHYKDNGKGIPQEHLDDIFAPFFTTRRGKGSSGLGLHISQNLVHTVLKGSISVSSKLNEGTQFTLTIPSSPV
ncbi:MAG: DUF3365 domain-containing protein [Gammaproteobacteria bacterium]|nr:DUF3365 domain-containing protein [Gammaproteobacteria bacterium]